MASVAGYVNPLFSSSEEDGDRLLRVQVHCRHCYSMPAAKQFMKDRV